MHIKGTKSKAANRQVPIPDTLYQKIKKKKGYLATSTVGKQVNESQYKFYWNALKREMNIEMGCKLYRNELIPPFPLDDSLVPYDLRHDYATRLAQRVPITQAKYILGHSDISVTSNIYQHLTADMLDTHLILETI